MGSVTEKNKCLEKSVGFASKLALGAGLIFSAWCVVLQVKSEKC